MNIKELQAAIESILFACGEPVSLEKISETLEVDKSTLKNVMEIMIDNYEKEDRGIFIIKLNNKYQLSTKPEFEKYIKDIMDIRRNVPLSSAATEVLAIVAYNQPVTKSFIEQIRGVDCSSIVSGLVSKGLIEEKGRLELPGKPLLYGTTETFLRCFSLENISELPPVPKKS